MIFSGRQGPGATKLPKGKRDIRHSWGPSRRPRTVGLAGWSVPRDDPHQPDVYCGSAKTASVDENTSRPDIPPRSTCVTVTFVAVVLWMDPLPIRQPG